MTPREALVAAADLLTMVGWRAGSFERDQPMDAVKAISLHAKGETWAEAMHLLREHIGNSVHEWQWASHRTGAEVVRALREAAR